MCTQAMLVSPLQCPATQAVLATPGFSCITSLQPMLMPRDVNHKLQTDCQFFLLSAIAELLVYCAADNATYF